MLIDLYNREHLIIINAERKAGVEMRMDGMYSTNHAVHKLLERSEKYREGVGTTELRSEGQFHHSVKFLSSGTVLTSI